ncbi:MAG: YaiI/YqxD family protein [Clostridia bacterium]|nr:YaiI/YqxD family protein [Clostridia bacterium]
MKIIIDADACPVVDIALSVAKEHGIECTLICDTAHVMQREGCNTITVDKGADSADFRLVNMLESGDIAITQDYGLAAMCLSKKANVLNQNGLIYTDKNIEQLLFTRYVGKKVRAAGGRMKGPPKRTHEQDENFQKALISLIEKAKRTQGT